jgi:hypothetical protein
VPQQAPRHLKSALLKLGNAVTLASSPRVFDVSFLTPTGAFITTN